MGRKRGHGWLTDVRDEHVLGFQITMDQRRGFGFVDVRDCGDNLDKDPELLGEGRLASPCLRLLGPRCPGADELHKVAVAALHHEAELERRLCQPLP